MMVFHGRTRGDHLVCRKRLTECVPFCLGCADIVQKILRASLGLDSPDGITPKPLNIP